MKKRILQLIIISFILNMFSPYVVAAVTATISSTPSPLTENNLNASTIVVDITEDQFVSSLSPSDFILETPPTGTIIVDVVRSSNTRAALTLAYDGSDMSKDLSFSIKVQSSALVNSTSDVISDSLPVSFVDGMTQRMFASTESPLSETNLDGATINFTNAYSNFKDNGSPSDFTLYNAPPGVSVASYTYIDSDNASITLSYDGTDFDSDFTNFYVRADSGVVTDYNISNTLPITASKEASTSLSLTSNPTKLVENTLEGSIMNLSLSGDTFTSTISLSDIQLNNEPSGLSVSNVTRDSDTELRVFLSFDGTDFDTDFSNFSITVLDSGLSKTSSITSTSTIIEAIKEIEGLTNYNSTGTSYPTEIEMTGYNSRSKELHINSTFYTERDVTGKTATFYYFVTVYDGNSNKIGNLGDITSPLSVTASPGEASVGLSDIIVTLNQAFPNAYRIVITIENTDLL